MPETASEVCLANSPHVCEGLESYALHGRGQTEDLKFPPLYHRMELYFVSMLQISCTRFLD